MHLLRALARKCVLSLEAVRHCCSSRLAHTLDGIYPAISGRLDEIERECLHMMDAGLPGSVGPAHQ